MITSHIDNELNFTDDQFDYEYAVQLTKNVLSVINDSWFRPSFIGFEHFPERNNPDHPLIFASNHSGLAFPWDAVVFLSGLAALNNYDQSKNVRALVSPLLINTPFLSPFFTTNFWKRGGGIDARFDSFEKMMKQNSSNLIIYPEGVPGIGKGWNQHYHLQRFSSSFVRMSLKYKTDIILVHTVNGEYINPYSLSLKPLNKLVKYLRLPFLPLGPQTLLPIIQPWMFYYGLPAKLTYVLGSRIKLHEQVTTPYDEISDASIRDLTDEIQRIAQTELKEAVANYGKNPYDFYDLRKAIKQNKKIFPFNLPFAWALLFSRFERHYGKKTDTPVENGCRSAWREIWANPFLITYFIPVVGWIPIIVRNLVEKWRMDKRCN